MANRSRGRRTDYTWAGGVVGNALASGAQALHTLVTVGSASTLIRSRGEVVCSIDGPTDNDKVAVGFGLYIATPEQIAVGPTAAPGPISDTDAEWIWHGYALLIAQSADLGEQVVARLTIDSKAMRRVKQTQILAMV